MEYCHYFRSTERCPKESSEFQTPSPLFHCIAEPLAPDGNRVNNPTNIVTTYWFTGMKSPECLGNYNFKFKEAALTLSSGRSICT